MLSLLSFLSQAGPIKNVIYTILAVSYDWNQPYPTQHSSTEMNVTNLSADDSSSWGISVRAKSNYLPGI